jgi:hypothetical protein
MKLFCKRSILAVMVLLMAMFVFGCGSTDDASQTNEGPITVSFDVIVDGQTQKTHVAETEADNLGDFLRESGIVEGENSEYGLYITTVDGVTADESNEEWWCVTKKGESVQTGVDSTPIADGDKFELTLMNGF